MGAGAKFKIPQGILVYIFSLTSIHMARLSTGVKGLDPLIEGGIKKGSISLVVGQPGCGKSTFCIQFLIAGMKAGEKCLYVSVEEQKGKFFDNMMRFGFDLAAYERQGLLSYHKTTVNELRSFLDQGVVSFEQYMDSDTKRVVIDSATALMLAYNTETSQRNSLLNLFEKLGQFDVTTLITSESDEGHGRFGVEYLVDSIFRLYYRKVGQERVRSIEIFKMRGTDHSKQEMVYRLSDGGIILYPDEKILT